jgi:UDP-N-acetylglucosamine--N-acetylmuramyl-(pentapeptide) pyrophosphoryl-undecaprenol N-acetylglucosamine transferase
MKERQQKILLTGGGTGGSVTPLLAIVDELRSAEPYLPIDFLWLGTNFGIEKAMVDDAQIRFMSIPSGKFRRYFSLRNFIDPFFVFAGLIKSFIVILGWRPDIIVSAGSFVAVPVVWAGWLCRVPSLIHQQDVISGLANKLCAPFARTVTVTFEKSINDFGKKAVWTGNPIRQQFAYRDPEIRVGQVRNYPILLVLGGGTGSEKMNRLVFDSLPGLVAFCRVIHVVGPGKASYLRDANYEQHEFLAADDMAKVYSAADLVVSRAGMSVLTELSYLGKPAIIIPLPESHQEANASAFHEARAAIILNQVELTPGVFVNIVKKAFQDDKLLNELGINVRKMIRKGAGKTIVNELTKILNK